MPPDKQGVAGFSELSSAESQKATNEFVTVRTSGPQVIEEAQRVLTDPNVWEHVVGSDTNVHDALHRTFIQRGNEQNIAYDIGTDAEGNVVAVSKMVTIPDATFSELPSDDRSREDRWGGRPTRTDMYRGDGSWVYSREKTYDPRTGEVTRDYVEHQLENGGTRRSADRYEYADDARYGRVTTRARLEEITTNAEGKTQRAFIIDRKPGGIINRIEIDDRERKTHYVIDRDANGKETVVSTTRS